MKPILEINSISKKYKLRGQESPYFTFRDALMSGFKKQKDKNEFWALQDISFNVFPGESIGIIGRNGAGKSTLLKILSRITPPTKGDIIARGRIASLLEVGTGFHAELTGRENIFLNGSILGLSKQEIKLKYDEIIDFSGVERFLDTPLKHYSSGMQLRLAFAVAAHLEPEILVIDEVLAVGDAEFQKKCLTKMGEVTSEGRTVLFVSHNLTAVQNLCKKSILLQNGNLMLHDNTSNIISKYLQNTVQEGSFICSKETGLFNNNVFDLISISLINEKEEIIKNTFQNNEKVWLKIEFIIHEVIDDLLFGYDIFTANNIMLYRTEHKDIEKSKWPKLHTGKNLLYTQLPQRLLNEGDYIIRLVSSIYLKRFLIKPFNGPAIKFSIKGGLSNSPYFVNPKQGLFAPIIEWKNNM